MAGLLLLCVATAWGAEENPHTKGLFLVATEQLDGTSFQETVILLTHYSPHGVIGLAINRPAGITLHDAFPDISQMQKRMDSLFLGGPVSTEVISALVRTQHPDENMQHIAANLYFTSGETALTNSVDGTTRIFAGYTGWAPGQLQAELDNGDWVIIENDPDIVFEEDATSLWQRLFSSWSGNWI